MVGPLPTASRPPAPGWAEAPPEEARPPDTATRRALRGSQVARKAALAVVGVALFVFAIALIKAGAGGLRPFFKALLPGDEPLGAFGLGWLMSYAVLSGSPVAATGLGMYASGLLDAVGLFAMIAGSRFGAAFIVLLIGFIYAARAHRTESRHLSLHTAVLSLLVTWTVYGPGAIVGLLLLRAGTMKPLAPATPPALLDFLDATFGAAAERVAALLPHLALVFALGVAAAALSFKMFDRALPSMEHRAGRLGHMAERIYRPSVLFAFGFAVTALTLSVSVSLSILVPLTVKGVVRRENLVPYIMGANVGTFIDTLAASVVVGGADAFEVVLAEMAGVAVASVLIIGLAYGHYERAVHRASGAVLASRPRLAAFLAVILICPLLLLLL